MFVEVGEMNEQRIQILKGIEEGQQVALDARLRAAAELKKRGGNAASPAKEGAEAKVNDAKETSTPAAKSPPA